ncbi:MAG: hypothetical protein ACR2H1_09955, partial [Limisphaerales bacterium]
KFNILIVTGITAAVFTGCVERRVVVREPAVVREEVVVTEEPPAPQVEVVGVAPSPNHVWIGGYWVRSGNRWTWRKGHWELRPHRFATYVPGGWHRSHGGWVWRTGHWQ